MTIDQIRKAAHDAVAVAETLAVEHVISVSLSATGPAVHIRELDFLRLFAGREVRTQRDGATLHYRYDLEGVRVVACGSPSPAVCEVVTITLPVVSP